MEKGNPRVTKAIQTLLVLIFMTGAAWLQTRIPFWSAWDMEFITIADLYRMTGDLIPQHINHTAFGMYLPMRLLWQIFPIPIDDLHQWMNTEIPLLALKEPVIWMRLSSTLAATILIVSVLRVNKLTSILILMITLPSLWLMPLQTIRTELWAVMWYAVALACLFIKRDSKWFFLFFLFSGLAFVTKYQGVFLHLGLVILYLFHTKPRDLLAFPSKRWTRVLLGLFLFLSLCSVMTYIPSYFAVFSKSNAPNIFFFAALAILLLPFFKNPYLKMLGSLWWFGAGIIAAFSFHFVLGLSLETAWEYLIFDWKMIFFRHSNPNIALARADNIFLWSLTHQGPLLLIWTFFLARSFKSWSNFQKILGVSYFALILVSFRLVTRGGWQDAIWNDFLILFGFAFFNLKKESIVSTGFVIIIFFNIWLLRDLPFQSTYVGAYDLDRYWKEPYESPEIKYTEIMSKFKKRKIEINGKIKKEEN